MRIAIYGRSGSGKTTISHHLQQQYGFVHCHPGARCRQLALELFSSDSKSVLNKLSDALRAIDPNVWLRVALSDQLEASSLIFDGARYESDFDYLRQRSFALWKVEAPPLVRRDRLVARNQEYGLDDESHPGEWALEDLEFDLTLRNDATIEALFAQVDKAVTEAAKQI